MKYSIILLTFLFSFSAFCSDRNNSLTLDYMDTNKVKSGRIKSIITTKDGVSIKAEGGISCDIPFNKIKLTRYEKDCDGAYYKVDEDIVKREFIEMFENAITPNIECKIIQNTNVVSYNFIGQTVVGGVPMLRSSGELLSNDAAEYYEQRNRKEESSLDPVFKLVEDGLKALLF